MEQRNQTDQEGLLARLRNQDEERRAESQRTPEWRRRALEAHDRNPWQAVTDLTERGAA